LEQAQGSYEITATMIKRAEIEFSRIRREALEQEWQSVFPSIKPMLDLLAAKKKSLFTISELASRQEAEALALAIYSEPKQEADPLHQVAKAHFEGAVHDVFLKHVVSVLYRIGALGVKLRTGERYQFSHVDQPLLPALQIPDDDVALRIHPMLWGTFRIQ
jgi:hypothetical protein